MEDLPLSELDMLIRLGLSFLAGMVVGFERSSRRQIAGLRTHVLICVGSTLLMLLSIWIPQKYFMFKGGDPGRIAAQVVSGIGFLGAGAILRLGNNIKGLTTAASLWLISAIGLALGAGLYIAAGIAFGISLFSLVVLDLVELRLFPAERTKILEVLYKGPVSATKKTVSVLKTYGIRVQTIDMDQSLVNAGRTKLRLLVSLPINTDIQKLAKALKELGDVERFELKEKF